jgi:tRNA A37 threonylcarbamoyladenosine biosynthesis protein TsaE
MILYQILNEKNLMVNEFQQRDMALCHLDIVKELSPEHQYHINIENFKNNNCASNLATNLIVNFS